MGQVRAGALTVHVGIVLVVAVIARVIALVLTGGYHPLHDDASYQHTALTVLNKGHYPLIRLPGGHWQATAYRPPGWPLVLTALWWITGPSVLAARLLLVALGALGAVLVLLIGRQLFRPLDALIAALLVAALPPIVLTGATLESETLFAVIVLAALLCALHARQAGPHAWRWLIGAGVLTGAFCLTRTNGLLLVPFVAALAVPRPLLRWRSLRRAGSVVLCAAAVVAPWTVRNADALHSFVPVSTETANTLAGTYNPVSMRADGQWLGPKRVGVYRGLFRRYGPGTTGRDNAMLRAVKAFVVAHPLYPAQVVLWNGERLLGLRGPKWVAFSLWTMSLPKGPAIAVWISLIALAALALVGVAMARGRSTPLAFWLIPLGLFLSAAIVNGETRLVIPVLPFLALLAALPISRVVQRAALSRA